MSGPISFSISLVCSGGGEKLSFFKGRDIKLLRLSVYANEQRPNCRAPSGVRFLKKGKGHTAAHNI